MRSRQEAPDTITWLQVHNLIPILTAIIGIVGVFNLLSNKVDLQNQRFDYLQGQTTACLARQDTLEKGLNSQALEITELQAGRAVKGASTSVYAPYNNSQATGNSGLANPTPKL